MDELHRLIIEDIVLGESLPWDIMDSFGRLLMRQGAIIQNQSHAKDMVDRGMYIEKSLYTKLPPVHKNRLSGRLPGSSKEPESPLGANEASVLHSINLAVQRLGVLLKNIHKFPDAQGSILEIVKLLRVAVNLNEDLALACIQLNQESGDYGERHCVDTAILSIIVAESMNKTAQEIQDIAAAALTMNISMRTLQAKLQGKKEAISDEDRASIHNHPIDSINILYEAGIEDSEWLLYVLLHHEHEDGTGYPVGNVKGEIPQNAKILSLADGFCARVSSRGYRKSVLPSVALRDIFIENKAQVDSTLASYFIKVLGLYPPGTFVHLKNNDIAIISHRGSDHSTCIAHSLVKANGELFAAPIRRDTSLDQYKIVEAIYPVEADVHVNLQLIWGPLASL
jgi:HD-GYP domain-containing protein (c-di-GMP phosphodiesterase class II)